MKPKHHVSSQHPCVNDDLPFCIASGTVVVKPNIKRMTKHMVEFEDGSFLDNVDAVIMATGWNNFLLNIKHI